MYTYAHESSSRIGGGGGSEARSQQQCKSAATLHAMCSWVDVYALPSPPSCLSTRLRATSTALLRTSLSPVVLQVHEIWHEGRSGEERGKEGVGG